MEESFLDRLTRLFGATRSRRSLSAALLGSLPGLLGLRAPGEAGAHNPLPACKQITDKRKRAACIRRAKRHNATSCAHTKCRRVANGTLRCRRGKCVNLICARGFANCNGRIGDGCETNVQTDLANCGRCRRACPSGTPGIECIAGKCRVQRWILEPGGPYPFTATFAGTLHVDAQGGAGGIGGNGENDGPDGTSGGLGGIRGLGARVRASIPVEAGEEFQIYVGGQGEDGQHGAQGGAGGRRGIHGANGDSGEIGLSGTRGGGGSGSGGWTLVRRTSREPWVTAGGEGGGGGAGGGGHMEKFITYSGGRGGAGATITDPSLGGTGGAGGDPGTGNTNGQTGGPGSPGDGRSSDSVIEPGVNTRAGSVLLMLEG